MVRKQCTSAAQPTHRVHCRCPAVSLTVSRMLDKDYVRFLRETNKDLRKDHGLCLRRSGGIRLSGSRAAYAFCKYSLTG
jgi:hypothetical protein